MKLFPSGPSSRDASASKNRRYVYVCHQLNHYFCLNHSASSLYILVIEKSPVVCQKCFVSPPFLLFVPWNKTGSLWLLGQPSNVKYIYALICKSQCRKHYRKYLEFENYLWIRLVIELHVAQCRGSVFHTWSLKLCNMLKVLMITLTIINGDRRTGW